MFVYRIEKKKYKDSLTGIGGTIVEGRWNFARYPIIYTSLNPGTARLETILNWSSTSVPKNRFRLKIYIPDDLLIIHIDKTELPKGWDLYPHSPVTREIGNKWLESGKSACLGVPCAEESDELNILVNPIHPDFSKIKVIEIKPIDFSERLRP